MFQVSTGTISLLIRVFSLPQLLGLLTNFSPHQSVLCESTWPIQVIQMNYSTRPFRTLINFSRIKLVVNPNGKSTSMTTWSPPFSIHDLRSNINNLFLFHPAVADRPPQLWNQIPVRITLNDGAHHPFFRNSHAIEYTQTQINPWSWSMTEPVNFSFGGLLILQDIPKSNQKHTQRLNPNNHFSKHSHGAGNFFIFFLLYILQGILTFPQKKQIAFQGCSDEPLAQHSHNTGWTQIHREIVRWNSQQPITTETLPVPRKLRACCTNS